MVRSARAGIDPLETLRLLRASGGVLLEQALLHGELARIGWAQERARLQKMLVAALLGFAGALCTLLLCCALILASAWATPWRLPAIALLIAAHVGLTAMAWRCFLAQGALGGRIFDDTRRELIADAALLKETL